LPKPLVAPYEKEPMESLIDMVKERPKVLYDVVKAFRNARNGTSIEGGQVDETPRGSPTRTP
jgi:hypothetical protein